MYIFTILENSKEAMKSINNGEYCPGNKDIVPFYFFLKGAQFN